MGVDYCSCSICGEGYPDNDEYCLSCEECDNEFCSRCVEKYKLEYNEDKIDCSLKNCPVCNNKIILDKDILEYCLEVMSKTKEEIITKIINMKENKE